MCPTIRVMLSGLLVVCTTAFATEGADFPAKVVLPANDPPDKALLSPESLKQVRRINELAFSADGTRLVAANWNVTLWDWASGKTVYETAKQPRARFGWNHASEANLLLLMPAGTNTRFAIDMQSGKPVAGTFMFPAAALGVVAPDGSVYAGPSAEENFVSVIEVRTGKTRFKLELQPPLPKSTKLPKLYRDSLDVWGVAISTDSKYLAAANGDGAVTVWDLSNGEQVAFFDFDQKDFTLKGVGRIFWVLGHEALIVPTKNGHYWCDLESQESESLSSRAGSQEKKPKKGKDKKESKGKPAPGVTVRRGTGYDEMNVDAFSPDGRWHINTSRAAPSPAGPASLSVYDLKKDARALGVIPGIKDDRAWSVIFSPDAKRVAIGTNRGRVVIYSIEALASLAKAGELIDLSEAGE